MERRKGGEEKVNRKYDSGPNTLRKCPRGVGSQDCRLQMQQHRHQRWCISLQLQHWWKDDTTPFLQESNFHHSHPSPRGKRSFYFTKRRRNKGRKRGKKGERGDFGKGGRGREEILLGLKKRGGWEMRWIGRFRWGRLQKRTQHHLPYHLPWGILPPKLHSILIGAKHRSSSSNEIYDIQHFIPLKTV